MKGIATLIRLHRLKLTDRQRRLAALQAVANGFRTEIAFIERRTREEAASLGSAPETAHMLGGFIQASIARRRTLEGSLADIDRDMEAVRRDINAAFQELKKYELIEERRAAEAKKTQRKRDRRAEDELGMSMHRQAKMAAGG
jgi:flagellar export protein FliJ